MKTWIFENNIVILQQDEVRGFQQKSSSLVFNTQQFVFSMIEKKVVKQLVDQWLEGKDYFMTDLTISADDRIVVEIDHKDGVWIEDCVELSRFIESGLNRDEEDFELEVGSAGIGQPFKVLRQYENNVGEPVEVMTTAGKKLTGTLKEADADGFTVTVEEKVKAEGEKRPKLTEVDYHFGYDEVKYTKYLITFK